jgi:hypothetical protein
MALIRSKDAKPDLIVVRAVGGGPIRLHAKAFAVGYACLQGNQAMPIAESIRGMAISDLLKIPTVQECWPSWQTRYRVLAGTIPTANSLLQNLGSDLGGVFAATNTGGRNQSSQSGGGAAWEAIVCWYLNICLLGTRTVVVKKKTQLPTPVRDALTVTYGTVKTNTESDLVAITFPSDEVLDAFSSNYSGAAKLAVDARIATLLGQTEVCVIQCKTNWNDNAQIPMLWDMIYSATGFSGSRASVGINGYAVKSLRKFSYAFMTVPSNDPTKYKKDSMAVIRLSSLSGGNYWGRASKNGVAGSAADIFNKVFSASTQSLAKPWRNHLDEELQKLDSDYGYFNY